MGRTSLEGYSTAIARLAPFHLMAEEWWEETCFASNSTLKS